MAISVFSPGGGTGDFEFPATDGTSGQALVTNGAGVLDFATIKQGFDYIQSTPTPAATTPGQLWYKPTDGSVPLSAGLWQSNGLYWLRPDKKYFQATTYFSPTQVRSTPTRHGTIDASYGGFPLLIGPFTWSYISVNGGLFNASNYHRLTSPTVRYTTTTNSYGGDTGYYAHTDGVTSTQTLAGAAVGPPMPLPTNQWQTYTLNAPNTVVGQAIITNLAPAPTVAAGTPGELFFTTRAYFTEVHP